MNSRPRVLDSSQFHTPAHSFGEIKFYVSMGFKMIFDVMADKR